MKNIQGLKNATLDEGGMAPEDVDRLRDPGTARCTLDMSSTHLVKALRHFIYSTDTSRNHYEIIRKIDMATYPGDEFLSFDQARRTLKKISGVVPMRHDMCISSCAAYTGAYSDLVVCPYCSEPRYHVNGRPRRQFTTIPIGPVLQAFYASPQVAGEMHYLEKRLTDITEYLRTHNGQMQSYDDTACSHDLFQAWSSGQFTKDDIALQISIDGAQLYRDKASDCWMFIWIIHNLRPGLRYTKSFVIPGSFVPGPNKPREIDSFLFPSLYHLAAIQREGLRILDASTSTERRSNPIVIVASADSPGAASMSGFVGHSGKQGCRVYCAITGRRREGDPHYYPVMSRPDSYTVPGCSHDDVTFKDLQNFRQNISATYEKNLRLLLSARNLAQYNKYRLQTGLCKPTLFSGITTLGVPGIFTMDLMHLSVLNDPDLLLGLWRGTIKCYLPDNISTWNWCVLKDKKYWKAHGDSIEAATPFIPSSFGRAPRNPAEKINSGYKAWEFQLYIYGLGPVLLRHILPQPYWEHYCKLVAGIQILQRPIITPDDLRSGNTLLKDFVKDFEVLYYQRQASRIHFIRHSVHLLTHIAPETVRAGPLACYAQWTMETAIGNLGKEIRQDKDPYRNLEERGVIRAQINSVMAMYPKLDINYGADDMPIRAHCFPDKYAFLPRRDNVATPMAQLEYNALMEYWRRKGWPNGASWPNAIVRWARLQLPNGQRARSVWSESTNKSSLRRTSCVEVSHLLLHKLSLTAILDRLQWKDAHLKRLVLLLPTV
jgi:Transposase family tnp2